jgi:hypothetical protein
MASRIEVTVRLDPGAAQEYDEIVAELGKVGLSNVSCSRRFLMIHGEIEEGHLNDLQQVRGVASVRPSQIFKAVGS